MCVPRRAAVVCAFLAVLSGSVAAQSFLPATLWDMPPSGPHQLAAGDLDGDGDIDLVTGSGQAPLGGSVRRVSVLFNDGSGGFATTASCDPCSLQPRGVAAGDFDGDGDLDVVTASFAVVESPEALWGVSFLGNNGDGSLAQPRHFVLQTMFNDRHQTPRTCVAADFDMDSLPDFVVGPADNNVYVLYSDLDEAEPVLEVLQFVTPEPSPHPAVGDIDGDGDVDILTSSAFFSPLVIVNAFTPATPRGFTTTTLADMSNYSGPVEASVLVDTNNDGEVEIVLLEGDVLRWLGDVSTGHAATGLLFIETGGGDSTITAADFDTDGFADVVITITGANSRLEVYRNDGSGDFSSPPIVLSHGPGPPKFPRDVDATDLTGDGFPDVVAPYSLESKVRVWLASTFRPFRRGDANQDGGVNLSDAPYLFNHLFRSGPAPACPEAADSDDTGKLNLTDGVVVLRYLFKGGQAPPAPGPVDCGDDPAGSFLGCSTVCP